MVRTEIKMPQNVVVRASVDEKLKKKATRVLKAAGYTVSDVMRMTLDRIARDQSVECLYSHEPNALTIETLEKSERGEELTYARNVEDLFRKLRI
jgi:DNA-damage-inducible protein J